MAQSTARSHPPPIRFRPRPAQAAARAPLPRAPLPGPRRGRRAVTATIPGASASTPPGSPWASSSPRSSPTTTPATTPSIASRSSATIRGSPPVAPETTSYCEARQRLPEELAWDLVRRTGRSIHRGGRGGLALPRPGGQDRRRLHRDHARYPGEPGGVPPAEDPGARAWGSRSPGSSWSSAWPWARCSRPRSGPYQGKQTSELALLRQVIDRVPARRHRPGRPLLLLVLGDRGLAGPRRRRGGAAAPVPHGRLPPRAAAGPGGPPRHLDEAGAASPTG